jgi:hypothetical protein
MIPISTGGLTTHKKLTLIPVTQQTNDINPNESSTHHQTGSSSNDTPRWRPSNDTPRWRPSNDTSRVLPRYPSEDTNPSILTPRNPPKDTKPSVLTPRNPPKDTRLATYVDSDDDDAKYSDDDDDDAKYAGYVSMFSDDNKYISDGSTRAERSSKVLLASIGFETSSQIKKYNKARAKCSGSNTR